MADERLRCPRCMKPLEETVRTWIRNAQVERPDANTVRIGAGGAVCSCGTAVDPALVMKQLKPAPGPAAVGVALMAAGGIVWLVGPSWAGLLLAGVGLAVWASSLRRAWGLAGASFEEIRKRMRRSSS
jgi:hypothetical protein